MPQVAALTVKVNADITSATRGLDAVEQKVTGMGGRLGQLFSTAGGFLLARGVEAVIGNVGQLASAALDFEAQMANVNSIIKVSGDELQMLSDQVLGLTNNPGITHGPADLAAGLYNVVSSGLEGAAALETLEVSAMAATAGLTSTDIAAQVIVGTMNAYGQETYTAAQVADVLFKTVDSGVITFEQLASNMGQVLAVGASLGVGVDQLGAAYAQMTLNAVPAAQAETQIAALMRSALQPTAELTQAVQKHGYASAEALIAAEGMPGYLRVLMEESDGSKEALLGLVGSTEAMNAATILGKDGVEEYNKLLFEMTGQLANGGALTEALEKQMLSANFAIAKAKQQVTVAATVFMGLFAPAIRAGAEAFTGFLTGGVIPFTNVISQAVRGGFEFRDVVDTLPQPLRRTAGAVGTIVEGVGDLVRSFQDRGLSGMLDTLFEGGEGEQILGGLRTLAEEGWDLFTGTLGTLAGAGIDLLPVVVTGGVKLAGEIGRIPGRAYEWLKGKLFGRAGEHGAGLSDGTGSGEYLPLQSDPITISDVVIEGGVRLVGGVSSAAGRLRDWIEEQIFGPVAPDGTGGPSPNGAGEGFKYDIATVTFNVLDAIIDLSAEDVEGWIQTQIDQLGLITTEVGEWAIILAGDPTISTAGGSGDGSSSGGTDPITKINNWLQEQTDKINGENGLAIDATNWVLRITGNPDMQVDNAEDWNDLIQRAVRNLDFGEVFEVANFGFFGSLNNLEGAIIDDLNSTGRAISNAVTGLKEKVVEGVIDLFPDRLPSVDLPDISGSITGWLGDEVEDIRNWIIQETPEFVRKVAEGDYLGAVRSLFGDGGGGGESGGTSRTPSPIPQSDLEWYGDYFGNQPYMGQGDPKTGTPGFEPAPAEGYSVRARLDLDTTEAMAKMASLGIGGGFPAKGTMPGGNAFKATFDLDIAEAQKTNTEALLWGTTWAGSVYESMFDIDAADAETRKNDAFLWGTNWAGSIFTARFSADLSPLESALGRVREIAQEISDLLPNSPAKKGPLARPVSFSYVAENLEATLDRMAGAAYRGMGRLGSAFDSTIFGPSLAAGNANGGGNTVIFITPDSDQFTAIAEEARRGGDFARIFPQLLREA